LDACADAARAKLRRLLDEGFALSQNDKKIVLYGQALASVSELSELRHVAERVEAELAKVLR
jgi:hypothetical protein